jgi:hypothetical protein
VTTDFWAPATFVIALMAVAVALVIVAYDHGYRAGVDSVLDDAIAVARERCTPSMTHRWYH